MGYKIREVREAMQMSQEELSKKAGVSRAIISGIESGRSENVTIKTLKKIASALNVGLQDIFFAESA